MSWINKYLSSDEIKKIEDSIVQVEHTTLGEIVPVIVRRSSAVGHVPLVLTLGLTLMIILADLPFSHWLWIRPWVYLWPVLLIMIYFFSQFLAKSLWIQKVFVSENDEMNQVHQRAQFEFYANKLHNTQDRTGILIFVSVMEKKAVILADEGISKKLPAETWNNILQELGKYLHDGKWSEGFVHAIEKCGDHLKTHFPIAEINNNEIKNHLVVKE